MMVGVPTRSGNTLRFPWEAAEPSAYRTYQWNILEAFLAQNIFVRRSIFFGYEQKLLISTAGGRFHFITVQGRHLFKKTTFTESTLPRALLEPPCASHSGVSRLMGLHYRSSHRRPFALPANVFGGTSNRNGFRWDEQCAVPVPGVAAFRSNQRCSASDYE